MAAETSAAPADAPRLEMLDISKRFPGVIALSDVSLRVRPGEIHALVGENGAGKSTLIKILSGAYPADSGRILLDGSEVAIADPRAALDLGIVTIYQESNLVPELSVAENIFMGRLPLRRRLWFDRRRLIADGDRLLAALGARFSARTSVGDLSPAQRKIVELTRALSVEARIVVLDEPTAALSGGEVDVLLGVMRRLRERGVSVVFVTHRLPEILAVADRATVLRDGRWIATDPIVILDEAALITRMVGREIARFRRTGGRRDDAPLLAVHDFTGDAFTGVSFDVRPGEVVGMFGLVGAGRTELVRA
ncbi:MAG: sugar ABC transporter ATP-binding protein, partial [Thermomicrobiales bacterium]|nr:sugar ABC transporter ATP-binding protein [Thermomicrobiales bacterium]